MEDRNKYGAIFKMVLFTAMGLILFVFFVWRFDLVAGFLKETFKILRPVIIGGAIAFILNAYVNKVQKLWRKDKVPEKVAYILSVIIVYIVLLGLLTLLICFVVPQLAESVRFFFESFETYYKNFMALVTKYTANIDFLDIDEEEILATVYESVEGLKQYIPDILSKTYETATGIFGALTDVFIGFVFSVYILIGKKDFKRQTSRGARALLDDRKYSRASYLYSLTSKTLSSFISGQLTEAFILGTLCFIGMCIFRFEYALLISVIIGITNLIPIFGPILGTIPCAFILLLVNPQHAIWFVVYIIILQQIESQLIYPQVVGTSVGLKPFWTLFAIVVGGGLFGVIGMLFAVPAMSIIYTLVGEFIAARLKEKGIADDSSKEEKPKRKSRMIKKT